MHCRTSLLSILIGFLTPLLVGCGAASRTTATAVPAGIAGAVHGGQQPVAGATIQLYAVGSGGSGSPATALIATKVLTDNGGGFNITGDYTCPSASSLVYIVATGGQPAANVANPQLALMAALGACGSLTATTDIQINELTTVAAVYQFAPFMTSYAAIGSSTSDAPVLLNAFSLASQLVNTSTGTMPGLNVPAAITVPVAQVDTIANLLASCINSPGGRSGDGSICGNFFLWATPAGGTAPSDAIGALLNLANNPAINTGMLYSLISANAPFQPTDSTQPADFSIPFGVLQIVNTSSQFASAVAGLDSGQTGGTVVIEPNTAVTIGGQITISAPMTFICEGGSSITAATGGNLFIVTGSNVTVQGCTFTDIGEPAQSSLFVVKAPYFTMQNSTVTDTNSNSSALAINSPSTNFTLTNNTITGTVHMQGASQGLFQGNTVKGILFGEDNTTYIQAIGNTITTGAGGGSSLQFHGTASGNTVANLTLTGNHLTQAGTYCIEVGAFGVGTIPPVNVVASNNTCDLSGNGTSGGYSFDTTVGAIVSNNIFNADGHTFLVAAIEIVNSYNPAVAGPTGPGSGAVVTGNTLNGGGLTLNKQSNNLFDSNYLNMGSGSVGIFIGGVYAHSDNNVISNNTIVCPKCVAGSTNYKLIWMQNTPGTYPATAIGNQITGNTFIGNNSGEFGVWLENDDTNPSVATSDFDQTTISGNIFQNVTNDIHPQKDSENIYLTNNTCGAGSVWLPSLPANVTIHGETGFCTTIK
jgi:hypothetical protein